VVLVRRLRPDRRQERGVIAVVTAILAVVLLGLAALVVDLGHVRDVKRQAQNAADASSLAAGNVLYLNTAVTPAAATKVPQLAPAVAAAKAYALKNFGVADSQWTGCTDPGRPPGMVASASTPCISFDSLTAPLQVRVKIPTRTVPTPLGSLLGKDRVDVAASARARLKPGQESPCALCILGTDLHDLQNGDAIASGGDIAFNGSVKVSNNGLVATDGIITVQGTASGPPENYTPFPTTGVPAVSDPLAFVALPPDMSALTVKTDPCTQGPGKYGSVNLRARTCTLAPGLYVVAGSSATWDLSGNDTTQLLGTGVSIYLTCGTPSVPVPCTPGQQGATIDATGNALLGFTAPTSGPMQGLAIAMDRNNSSTVRLSGNGAAGMSGTVYMPSGILEMSGNGCASIDALIVVKDLSMNGNPACLRASYVAGHNVDFPPGELNLNQ
jgi:Flp pilus assembly protein TadG